MVKGVDTGKGRELGPLCHSMAAMDLNGRRRTEARFSVALRAVSLLRAQLAPVYHTGYVFNDQGMRSKWDGMNTGSTGPGSSQLLSGLLPPWWVSFPECISILAALVGSPDDSWGHTAGCWPVSTVPGLLASPATS